jgi:NADH dehydrogenase FAD-containing subunit
VDASSIVVPIRQVPRHVVFLEAEATAIDFATRTVPITYGLEARTDIIRFDKLLIAVGSQTRYRAGFRRQALGMKTIYDPDGGRMVSQRQPVVTVTFMAWEGC